MSPTCRCRCLPLLVALALLPAGFSARAQTSSNSCTAQQSAPLLPADPQRCAQLAEVIRHPSALPLDEYERQLGDFLRSFCHRDAASGWQRDKRVRDTGPFTATLENGAWVGTYYGTHAPVVIWYSREMIDWLETYRPEDGSVPLSAVPPVPDGAVMVKEMFPAPAAECVGVDPTYLLPTSGAAVMVRDQQASHDGWFWGWFGWSGWDPDWPAGPQNRYPYMGFGQYCVNCHASAEDNLTFAGLRNIEGEPGEPLVFLSQSFFEVKPQPSHHRLVSLPTDDAPRLGQPFYPYNPAFVASVPASNLPRPSWNSVSRMPSETYDNVWVQAGGPTVASEFVTSDQCIGCHDAGSTGLQFDMTVPNPHGDNLLNLSPYATWRTSPMGIGGRDPIFFAQLASETETFHPQASPLVQDTCLGCHGILGQRQYTIDHFEQDEDCGRFLRRYVQAAPWPAGNPQAHLAPYGALARDGISCTACHRMLVGEAGGPAAKDPQNRCVDQRQAFLNPDNKGFARTFTGSFLVGPPDQIYGPFETPKVDPMDHALGNQPVYNTAIRSSELCGSCHTVHLPVMTGGKVIGYTYEQTTYPEWAFSDYRTGSTPQGDLPYGAGPRAESCQSCHMPSKTPGGQPYRSKIASIQEFSNFPEAEHNLGPEAIDLTVRESFARHTLVGLNVFLIKMAQQFPDILGLRTQDPMLVSKGLDPLLFTEQAMLNQASASTASLAIGEVQRTDGHLRVPVTVTSEVGHKLPSGVGFRRVFIELSVLDRLGNVLWASGRTNDAGVLIDDQGQPIAGELWWQDDCSARRGDGKPVFQPHYQVVSRQDQAQIYQELVTAPAPVRDPRCGKNPVPGGQLTTSFLSICGHVKDNRLLPHGFLPLDQRVEIAEALGAGADLAKDSGPYDIDDPDYRTGGGDSLVYDIDLAELAGQPASVQATLYYQATPPYFLQDRFCTSKSEDTQRLYFLAGHLNLQDTEAQSWKLKVVGAGPVSVPEGVMETGR